MSRELSSLRRFRRPCLAGTAQSGLSLVELMISIVIGLVILAALVALFLGTSRNNREMESASSVIENGRFAIQLLENDVIHAGYWGTFVPAFDDQTSGVAPADVPTAVPDPCLDYASWTAAHRSNLIGIPVQAYSTAAVCGGVITGLIANSDVLVVRHADTCVAGDLTNPNCEADTPGKLYFQSALCVDELPGYELGVTGVDVFGWTRRDCADANDKRQFVSSIYFVANVAGLDANGEATTIPTLMRSEFELDALGNLVHLPAVPLIEGIEAFRVEIGIDDVSETGGAVDYTAAIAWVDPETRVAANNRGDGSPDGAFVRCTIATPCTAAQLMNVTAVRIYVLARSREPTVGYTDNKVYAMGLAGAVDPPNDGFKRHVYSTTVRLPNVAGRRVRPGA
jgi:type IV pilus assembly protein PilW